MWERQASALLAAVLITFGCSDGGPTPPTGPSGPADPTRPTTPIRTDPPAVEVEPAEGAYEGTLRERTWSNGYPSLIHIDRTNDWCHVVEQEGNRVTLSWFKLEGELQASGEWANLVWIEDSELELAEESYVTTREGSMEYEVVYTGSLTTTRWNGSLERVNPPCEVPHPTEDP